VLDLDGRRVDKVLATRLNGDGAHSIGRNESVA
jgi:hypothetical protein